MARTLSSAFGLARSLVTYYVIPGRIRRLTRFYAQFVKRGDLCFDIGAHVGNHILAMRRLGARVVALEPQPLYARLLRRWYGSGKDVTILSDAVGPEPGSADLFVSARTPTVSTLSRSWTKLAEVEPSFARVTWDSHVTVPVTTLDALIRTFGVPVFCKIDVEGFELEVLRGLSQPLPHVAFEYLPATRDLAVACLDRLAELGRYEINWSVGEEMQLASEWVTPERAVQYLRALPARAREGNLHARLIAAPC